MKLAEIAPELRPRADRLPRVPLEEAGVLQQIRTATAQITPVEVPGVDIESTPGWRVHRPRAPRPGRTLLWIHGGGFVVGRAAQDDRLCAETARELGITVVSVEYRLAPDAQYPAALDDCHAAWTWARDQAGGPDGVIVGGQSAGGALAAALVQRLCDRGERPHAQWLFCPMLDDRTAARRELDDRNHRGWDNRLNRFGWRSYLGTEPGTPDLPAYAVPARREDLSGLPPAWIGVGDIDLLHDESAAYARRLREAGVDATLHVVPGAPHGFEAWAPDTAVTRDYLATARAWLGDRTAAR